ncbi:MAG: amidohydrolase family protein [Bacillota bacterium]
MRIDFEAYWSPQPLDGKVYGPREILEMEDTAGIDMVVLMPSPDFRPDNRGLAEAIRGYEDRIIGCAQVNPRFGEEAVEELETAITRWGLKALKLMPTFHGYAVESPTVDPVMEKARELGIPVNIHSGSYNCYPLEIAALAQRYPEVPIIMDHMGYRFRENQAILAARMCPNIYLGTTLICVEPILIKFAVKELGPERVVFGSNAPGSYPDLCVEAIRRLNLGAEAEVLIFGENLARIYKLV